AEAEIHVADHRVNQPGARQQIGLNNGAVVNSLRSDGAGQVAYRVDVEVGAFAANTSDKAHPVEHRHVQHEIAGRHIPVAIIQIVELLDVIAPREGDGATVVGPYAGQAQIICVEVLVGIAVVAATAVVIKLPLRESALGG